MENMEKEENTYQRCILEIFIAGQPWGWAGVGYGTVY